MANAVWPLPGLDSVSQFEENLFQFSHTSKETFDNLENMHHIYPVYSRQLDMMLSDTEAFMSWNCTASQEMCVSYISEHFFKLNQLPE